MQLELLIGGDEFVIEMNLQEAMGLLGSLQLAYNRCNEVV